MHLDLAGERFGRRSRRAAGAVCLLAAAWIGVAAAGPAGPEATETPDAPDPMAPLAAMVGTWEGEGWIRQGPSEPVQLRSREIVESRLGGEVLLIEGIHHDRDSGRVGHHALAMLSWDPADGVYRFRSHVAGKGPGNFEGHLEDGVFVWGGPTGRGTMRYRITIEDDTWREVGEFSVDGETWSRFFEMTLTRR